MLVCFLLCVKAGRDLYRARPTVTQGLGFCALIPNDWPNYLSFGDKPGELRVSSDTVVMGDANHGIKERKLVWGGRGRGCIRFKKHAMTFSSCSLNFQKDFYFPLDANYPCIVIYFLMNTKRAIFRKHIISFRYDFWWGLHDKTLIYHQSNLL